MKNFTIAITLLMLAACVGAEEVLPPASLRFEDRNADSTPDFQKHIVPLLGRLGCNSAKCHGSFQGQGEFRLSLFGFDFQADVAALRADASAEDGQRLDVSDAEQSLIVRKPSGQTDHEGGTRFDVNSWEHHVLLRWIESGAKGAELNTTPADRTVDSDESDADLDDDGGDSVFAEGAAFFAEKIQPLLESHCYECHGYDNPKAGLRVTRRKQLIEGGDSGPAIVPNKPDDSLLMQAVRYDNDDLQMPPSGRLQGQEIANLEQWIRMGAPWPSSLDATAADPTQVLAKLTYEPAELLFDETGQTTQLRVIAEWETGEREDVTCLSRFQTNNDAVVTVNHDGLATSVGEGDTHIVAFYDNGVAAIPVLRRVASSASQKDLNRRGAHDGQLADQPVVEPVDRFVDAKLDKLGIIPSERCTDAEFLRRVSIDMSGTLPTPNEVVAFLANNAVDKRARKIDEILSRSTYAAWWANKLCDFTGCNPASIRSVLEVATEEGYVKASEWYDWIYEQVGRNVAYDDLVAGIMLSDLPSQGSDMPHFWTRQSLKEPKDTAMSVAHSFLGIQLQCAECHKHPFDRWTQSDFNQFAQFFAGSNFASGTKRRDRDREKETVNNVVKLKLLRSHVVSLKPGDDAREPIMQWMRKQDNPWFARAFVNRVWAGYFNQGIVDPPDQFTPANPPSNPQLLDWLTTQFVQHEFDMKWLHRQIANSDTYQRSWKPNATNRDDRRNFSRAIPRRIPAEVVYDGLKQATAAPDKMDEVRTNLRRRASGHLSMRMAGTHAMKVFGKPDRSMNCDCERVNEPTLLQAIFTQNDPLVRMRIADSDWIIEIEEAVADETLDQNELVQQIWLRTVSRPATEGELLRAKQHLESASTLVEGVGDLMWAMMNTKEFLLNH